MKTLIEVTMDVDSILPKRAWLDISAIVAFREYTPETCLILLPGHDLRIAETAESFRERLCYIDDATWRSRSLPE